MMGNFSTIKMLRRLGIFNSARSFKGWLESRDDRRINFFRQFLSPGDLCFDIGANVGQRTDIFLRCGARVIAVEPQEECARFLSRKYVRNPRVTVVAKAVDAEQGRKEMLICEANALSSLAQDWVVATQKSGRCAEYTWNERQVVVTTTLDALIAEFGLPKFTKIDVEGFELNVLSGLSRPLPFLSFEMAPESRQMVYRCIERLANFDKTTFNHSGDPRNLTYREWKSCDGIIEALKAISDHQFFGEVYARCP